MSIYNYSQIILTLLIIYIKKYLNCVFTWINAFPRHFLNILNENSLKNLKYLTFEDYSQIFFEASSNCNDESSINIQINIFSVLNHQTSECFLFLEIPSM